MQTAQCRIDRNEFTINRINPFGPAGIDQTFAKQGDHFTIGAAALAGILIQNHLIKSIAEDFGLLADIVIAPVAGPADHHQATHRRHVLDAFDQRLDGIRIVAVVGNQRRTLVIEHIEATRGGLRVVDKAGQGLLSDLPVNTQRPGCCNSGHGIFDLEADRAITCQRNVGERDLMFLAAFATDDGIALDINNALALGAMRGENWIGPILGKENHRAVAMMGHGGNHRVGCI